VGSILISNDDTLIYAERYEVISFIIIAYENQNPISNLDKGYISYPMYILACHIVLNLISKCL
jgi:hypothetical protein